MFQRKVVILLSTYNGKRFVKQQLDSIYKQSYPNIEILVRDDASTDATQELLEKEQELGRIKFIEGDINLGVTASFFDLLGHAERSEADYVAFCDQDDIWLPNKIERAVSKLSTFSDCPALYCSQLEIVDEQLNSIGFSILPRKIGFGNALVENVAVGCTMVLNRKALDLLCKQNLPDVYIHDWWCYLTISCFGQIVFDHQPLIKYRQHNDNAIGAANNSLVILKRKFSRLLSGKMWISEQAKIYYSLFSDRLSPDDRTLLELLIKAKTSFLHRLILVCSKNIWRQKIIDNIILRIVILMNRF